MVGGVGSNRNKPTGLHVATLINPRALGVALKIGPLVNSRHSREIATGLNPAGGVSRRASDRLRHPKWMV